MITGLQKLLLDAVKGSASYGRLEHALETAKPGKAVAVKGLRASSFSGVVAALANTGTGSKGNGASDKKKHPLILAITGNYERSGEIYDDLQFFGVERTFHYPKSQVLPYDDDEPLLEEQVKHLEFLHHLVECGDANSGCEQSAVCATSVEALFTRVAPLDILKKLILRVDWGERLDPEKFAESAADLGFERVPTVEARGEFAIRGGILDIFPLDAENPYRIDLFGDEIESMRAFDVHTQRSLRGSDNIEKLTILPARESVLIAKAMAGGTGENSELPTLLDVLPPDTLLVFDHPEVYQVLDERFRQLVERQYTEHSKERALAPWQSLYATLEQVQKSADRYVQVHHSLIVEGVARTGVTFETTSFETTKPSLEHYITQIRKRVADGYIVSIICDNDGQAQRMEEMLRENVIGSVVVKEGDTRPIAANADLTRDVVIAVGLLHAGFILPEGALYIVTDREIFGRYKRRHVYRKIYKGAPIADAREIRKGDFVVHLEHGIGRFEGIRTQNVDGKITDFIELVYADEDKLLVPVEKIAYVQKFAGPDQPATLDKLGSKKWTQRRQKSEEEIKKLAGELLQLYARRAAARGYSYGGDTVWQREFESSFLYQETPDQMRAIEDVKRDMASDKPMDRLVCGDVGYGKTEVAIRAAFKAITDKKQVALLCPTTILARQHYDNFRERYADYPIKVEMLSRFRTPKETREVMKGLADGSVNMVVGTHQLLSKSVQFKDLGLVIVDEEQRFGVSHKERLKEMRASVDFLTLTATPIPRTLYMALSGLRDMSVINTPPADRHPIKTKIIHWNREQIEEAILRELNRGGQVYFVHNRVQNIHAIAEKIREIVPSARIAVGHGQMNEHDLEQIILDFVDQKYDILVSTTIIESGIDIPNVNTIIINRADAFGLAQLYQLRGRVGRENRRAYAYLIIPAGQAITEHAVARLQAIEEFTELGVGFNIAMRDMEIRGTGNLLGKEQHGTMNAIGFELYCKMLEEAVEEMRGAEREQESREVEIQWKASAYVPPDFVPVESQRVMLYKRIAEARTLEELDEIAAEVRDRYGEVPREVPGACEVRPQRTLAGPQGPHAMAGEPGAGKVAVAVAAPKAAKAKPAKTAALVEDLPLAVDNLFNIARMRLLGRKLDLRKIVGLKSGFKLQRPGILNDLGRLAQKQIKGGNPQIFADDPNALEFSYKDWDCYRPLSECVRVLQALNG